MDLTLISLIVLLFGLPSWAYNEEPCRSLGGFCLAVNGVHPCPNNNFISNQCPTQPSAIRCCRTVPFQEEPCRRLGGNCLDQSLCSSSGGRVVSGMCPSQPSGVRCCVQPTSQGTCASEVRSLACQVKQLADQGKVILLPHQVSDQRRDGATAADNIRDVCNGGRARRSSYGNAPGGSTCLSAKVLKLILNYGTAFYTRYGKAMRVNSIAGGSHSSTSLHYQGRAVDVSCLFPLNHCTSLAQECVNTGGGGCWPSNSFGSCAGHTSHVHCRY